MSFWDRLFGRKSVTRVRDLTIREPDGWTFGHASYAGETVSETSVLALSAAWACVNLIAGTIATLPLMVYRTDREGVRTVAQDHGLYRLLHDSPNADQTAIDFWESVCASIELWGNAFARKEMTGSRVSALVPVRPDIVTVRRLDTGLLEYQWTEDGQARTAAQSGMLHIRGFGGSPLGGLSTIRYGRQTFGLSSAIDRAAGSTFANGLRPSGVLAFKDWLTSEQRDIAEKRLTEKFIGAMNAGRPLVLEGGTEWKPLTINPEDAQMLESRSFSVEDICRFFGVPPFMIGHTEKTTSWGSGVEQAVLGFQKFTIGPRLRRIEQALTKQLLGPADLAAGLKVEFNLEGLLRGDSAGRAGFYQTMSQIGAMTINEIRAKENLPPVAGGDVPRMQMQNVPITEAGHVPAE